MVKLNGISNWAANVAAGICRARTLSPHLCINFVDDLLAALYKTDKFILVIAHADNLTLQGIRF